MGLIRAAMKPAVGKGEGEGWSAHEERRGIGQEVVMN